MGQAIIWMMKTLYLFRHAKSSWKDPELADIDRPLNGRGIRNSGEMGRYLSEAEWPVDIVLCSPARRTRDTAALFAENCPGLGEIRQETELYDAGSAGILSLIQQLEDGFDAAMVIAHNPGIEELSLFLGQNGDASARALMARKFPTCSVAIIEASCECWRDVNSLNSRLSGFLRARDLSV